MRLQIHIGVRTLRVTSVLERLFERWSFARMHEKLQRTPTWIDSKLYRAFRQHDAVFSMSWSHDATKTRCNHRRCNSGFFSVRWNAWRICRSARIYVSRQHSCTAGHQLALHSTGQRTARIRAAVCSNKRLEKNSVHEAGVRLVFAVWPCAAYTVSNNRSCGTGVQQTSAIAKEHKDSLVAAVWLDSILDHIRRDTRKAVVQIVRADVYIRKIRKGHNDGPSYRIGWIHIKSQQRKRT